MTFLPLQALKNSTEVEVVDEKIRCKTKPESWPIPVPSVVGSPRTDFSQLINCPEFVPRQNLVSSNTGQYSTILTPKSDGTTGHDVNMKNKNLTV